MRFTKIPASLFDAMQLDTGMLLYAFDPDNPDRVRDDDVICATKGGIAVTCVPQYEDMGGTVENCPAGTLELKKLVGWRCGMKFISLGMTAENLRLALGAAAADGKMVVPRGEIHRDDFRDLWWVGDTANGGMAAVQLMNALSDGGLSFRSTPGGRGQLSVSLAGHMSVLEPDLVPAAFYAAV